MGSRNAKRPTELEATRQDLRDALEQQAATSDVLKVISRSKADVQPVFDSVVTHAVRLCAGDYSFGYLTTPDGFRYVASAGGTPELIAIEQSRLQQRERGSLVGRVAIEERVIHIPDVLADADYALHAEQRAGGFRTLLGVPMKRDDGELVGVIGVARNEVRPFTATEIQLVQTFADQAVIAIENVRLFNETTESLERQTATSDLLKVISRTTTDIAPVFEAVLEDAIRLCGADAGLILRRDGDIYRLVASRGAAVSGLGLIASGVTPGRTTLGGRVALEGRTIHIRDATLDPELDPNAMHRTTYRSRLGVPLLRNGEVVGILGLWRGPAGGFTPSQVRLLETFADQAVIAVENVRLFNETRDALERQRATADILYTISTSPTSEQPVLDAVARNALRFCSAEDVVVMLVDGDALQHRAHAGTMRITDLGGEAIQEAPLTRDSVSGRATLESRTIHVPDIQASDEFPVGRAFGERLGEHANLAAPLLRQGKAIGTLLLRRTDPHPFGEDEVALAEGFAAQAVIAIENVRLFNETRQALERQTALAEILRVISQSPTDVQPVLDAIAESAARFCEAENVSVILTQDDGLLQVRARVGTLDTRVAPWPVDRTTVSGRAIVDGQTIQVPDLQAASDEFPLGQAQALVLNERTSMATPLIRDGRGIGVLLLRRGEVRLFSDKQIELVKVFADQAVIAIENVRLINEIQAKSAQLEGANQELAAASRHKSEFLANMSHELRTPLNAIIGFSDVLEQRLFGELNERQADYTHDIASSGRHLLDLVNEILDLSKVEAGKMQLEPSEFDLAETIRGALAFVRERAARHRIGLSEDVAADLGTVVADERKVRQVLLNLLSNAVKFTPDGGAIAVRARRTASEVEVAVADTGIGIAPEDQAKIFDEFQQVGRPSDRSREGTGLGLTLAKRFIELHGGRIWIESEVGAGTTFTFAIPVTGPAIHVTPGS